MKTFAITGGKGGVGKTTVCANLGLLLAESGKSVLMMDADLGLANLDAVLGVTPSVSLGDVAEKGKRLSEALTPGPMNTTLVSGGSGSLPLIDLTLGDNEPILHDFRSTSQGFDQVLIDLPAGLSPLSQAWLAEADLKILVVTPDPTSLLDAYATAKTIYAKQPDATIALLVNRCETEAQGREVAMRFQIILGRFLQKSTEFLGTVRDHPSVGRALRQRQSVVESSPTSPFVTDLRQVVTRLSALTTTTAEPIRLADLSPKQAA